MRTLFILYRKELGHYYKSPFGWVVMAFIFLMQGLSLSTGLKGYMSAPTTMNLMEAEFAASPLFWFYFLFMFPLITMRLFADEERVGTLEPLMTAPVKTWHVLGAKYLSAFTFYAFLWLPLLLHVQAFEFVTGQPAPVQSAHLLGAFAFVLLVGSFYCAVGCLASALTSSQIIAGITAMAALTLFYFIGWIPNLYGDKFPAAQAFRLISVQEHLLNFIKGLIDSRALVLYGSLTTFTLFLTHHIVDSRRWKH